MSNRVIPLVVLVALSLALSLFGALPQYEEWRTLKDEERQKTQELENRASYIENFKRLDETIAERSGDFARLSFAIPASPELPQLYELARQMASESGLVFQDLASSVTSESHGENGGKLREITLNMSVNGTYDALKELFASSRRSERLFQARGISFQAPEEGILLSATLELTAYSY